MPPLTPIVGTITTHPNNEKASTPTIQYSKAAQEYINFRRQRLIAARDARDQTHQEFDDMTFLQWYEMMKKADDQYVAPRKNKQDTSINLGTIRDKDTSLVEYAMRYDFEPVAQVYDDEDAMMEDLAETGEDLVRKSLMLESFRDKAKLIYRSMVAFGTAMVEDQWVERWTREKTFGRDVKLGLENTTWTEKLVKQYDGCQSKLWDLRKCYFGDIRKFFINGPQGQPYFFTVEYESYDVVKQWFGDWERWKYVPTTVVMTEETAAVTTYNAWWTLRPISLNYVEIIRYYDPVANEYAITLNGVDMLPIMETTKKGEEGQPDKTFISGFPLTAISPSGSINFAKYDLEPMHDFAYSKAQPAKMRVLADVENMLMKLMIIMMKQKAKPTMGNKSGRNFGEEVTDPATTHNDIREGDLFPVLPNYEGAQPSDFSFMEFVKKELDKNSIERSFQGMDEQPQDDTATKTLTDMKSQSLKVAALFDGIISGNSQLYWLRTYSIAKNWTKPIDIQIETFKEGAAMEEKKRVGLKYRSVSLPSEVEGGQKATKKIIFSKTPPDGATDMERSQTIHQQELDAAKNSGGGEERHTYLNPEQYSNLKLNWFYTCIPVPNGSDPLAYLMFAKQVQDAQKMFGPDSLNVKRLKHKFAAKTGEDFDTWFLSESELAQKQQQAAATMGANPNEQDGASPTIGNVAKGNPAQAMAGVF